MAVVLAYVDAVPGRLYPLVSTLQELAGRGHRVAVRCGADEAELLRGIGLPAEPLAPEVERFEPAACVVCHAGMGITQKALSQCDS